MIRRLAQLRLIALGVLILAIAAGIAIAAFTGALGSVANLWIGSAKAASRPAEKGPQVELFKDTADNFGLRLPAGAVRGLGIETTAAVLAVKERPLPPQIGTVNFDVDRLYAIRPRFQGELTWIKKVNDPSLGASKERPLRFGDPVTAGEPLAVVWSQTLGEKKAALIDAVLTWKLDEDLLDRQEKAWKKGAMALATYKATEKQVRSDLNAVLTAERTLKMWRVPDTEINTIKKTAEELHHTNKPRNADEETKWARSEIRVPMELGKKDSASGKEKAGNSGAKARVPHWVIVEKNTNLGDMVDPANPIPLFKVADLSRLQIWVHPPEEYLNDLRAMLDSGKAKWKISFQSDPSAEPQELDIVQIAPSLEPNQHTPMVIGYLDNPGGNKYLVGQFVTATIYVKPPAKTVEIPTEALNEVGGESLVFVQPDPAKFEYVIKRVSVVNRFKEGSFVRTELSEQDKKENARIEAENKKVPEGPVRRLIQPLNKDELVVTRGVVEMTAALEELVTESQAERQDKN